VNRVFIGIGSNVEPYRHIEEALDRLSREHTLVRASSFVVTVPLGYSAQPDFVNGAALVETELDHDGFTRYLKTLEHMLGRVKTANKWGPRTIDLDIVIWNGAVMDDDFYSRDFLKNAIREIGGPGETDMPVSPTRPVRNRRAKRAGFCDVKKE
jgi:2-amino-4-hydroxy-6-hydroxymethyldihydropteridine diphosphokinase